MWAAQEGNDRGAKGALTACWWGSSTASPPWVLTLIWGVMDVINLIHGAMIVS
jgi:branched-subunit amino acid ABC-type transport system permease component